MKRYILWDNDGVLVDTERWYFKATQRALGELGVHLDEETYQERMVRGASSWELAAQAESTQSGSSPNGNSGMPTTRRTWRRKRSRYRVWSGYWLS